MTSMDGIIALVLEVDGYDCRSMSDSIASLNFYGLSDPPCLEKKWMVLSRKFVLSFELII